MSIDFESARANFLDLLKWYKEASGDRNEAATRMHLIDKVFFDCLGWDSKEDCDPEEPHGKEYADYVFKCPMRVLLVEAKREGVYFDIPLGKIGRDYSLKTLTSSIPALKKAVDQVSGYCQHRGIPIAVVSNGHQYLAFIGSRDDGIAPDAGRVVLFQSMQAIADNFLDFWQLLSKSGIENRRLHRRLLGKKAPDLPSKLSSTITGYPGNKSRNILQADLQNLAEWVLEDIPSDDRFQEKFLNNCYCGNNALSQYSLLSKQFLVGRYESIFSTNDSPPLLETVSTKKGINKNLRAEVTFKRPVLLVGDVGSGKTTFIKQFIRVDAPEVFENAIVMYIDFGSKAALNREVQDVVLGEVEMQLRDLHNINIYEDSFIRKVFHKELKDFGSSIYAPLKEMDSSAFLVKEIEFLSQLTKDREKFLNAALVHISEERRKQVVFFLDNVDQRDDEIQQKVFLVAHGMADSWPAAIFVAIRPETFRRSRDVGALTGYHTKAFTIAPPRTDIVLEKRLRFAIEIVEGKHGVELPAGVNPKAKRGIEVFLKVLLQSFSRNEELAECIDNICGGNIRIAIDYLKSFIGSGHVDSQKILSAYHSGGYTIPVHEFMRAILFGDAEYFFQEVSPVVNLYDVDIPRRDGHFALPMLLDIAHREGSKGGAHGFVALDHVRGLMQGCGLVPDQVDFAMSRAWAFDLIETSGQVKPIGTSDEILIRVTSKGAYHVRKLLRTFFYNDAMIPDVPILDDDTRTELSSYSGSKMPISQRLEIIIKFKKYLDDSWALLTSDGGFDWASISLDIDNDIVRTSRSGKKNA